MNAFVSRGPAPGLSVVCPQPRSPSGSTSILTSRECDERPSSRCPLLVLRTDPVRFLMIVRGSSRLHPTRPAPHTLPARPGDFPFLPELGRHPRQPVSRREASTEERNAVVHRDGAGMKTLRDLWMTSSDTDQTSGMATNRGNKRMTGAVDAAETRVRTVVAPTGFEPVFEPRSRFRQRTQWYLARSV
jgi:hypothetical protein